MTVLLYIFGILALFGGCLGVDIDSFTRNAQSTNKKPRDVETVARIDYRRRGHTYDHSLGIVQPDVKETMDGNPFDISSQNTHPMTHYAADYFQWSRWSDWSPCSRTCGGGISFRQRTCNSRFEVATVGNCGGMETEDKLCCTEDCPAGSGDFLAMQCSQQNGKLFHERNFKWIPFFGKEGNTCEMTCMASNYSFYHSFGLVYDGTRCGRQRKGICIRGECVNIGCDGILRSNATEDACGICGGSNSTCRKYGSVVESLPSGDLSVGYKEIVVVPVGATHIRVKDYNENFLALVEGPASKYILNGYWVVKWTGQFQAAGSVGTYERKGVEETLNIIGPTVKELKIMILVIDEQQPLMEYEYWIPKNDSNDSELTAELKRQKVSVMRLQTEDDFRRQIIAAGLNFDAVSVPTMSTTTRAPSTTTTTSTTIITTAATTTHSPTTSLATTAVAPTKIHKYVSRRPNRFCTVCKRAVNKKKHFCESNFAFHVRVLPRHQLVRRLFIRYVVEIWHNYKSNVKVLRREYIWIPRSCCPRLRPYKHYLVMGRASKIMPNAVVTQAKRKLFKSPFIVNQVSYWYSWTKQNYKMNRMSKRLNCRRYRYNTARYSRRRSNTSR